MTFLRSAAVAALLALGAPILSTAALAEGTLSVSDPYARTMGGIGKSGAVFLVLENHGAADDRLVGVASDVAQKVELHTHKDDGNGVMQMVEVKEGFAVPAGGQHALARGGDHVMLMGLTRDLADGDRFALTLTFETAGQVTVDVAVDNARKPAMGEGHAHTGHGAGHGTGHGAAATNP